LFGIPLIEGWWLGTRHTFIIVSYQQGDSKNGAFIIALVMVIGVSFIFEMILHNLKWEGDLWFNSFYA
jgi:manganese transport protein